MVRTLDPKRHGTSTAPPTLRVVDDEAEVLKSVYDLLRIDFNVIMCEQGAEALALLGSDQQIHLVLSDQRMPGMSGVAVLRNARRLRPETARLLDTAYTDSKRIVAAIDEGYVFQYIDKPWGPEELHAVVRKAIEQQGSIVEQRRLIAELPEVNLWFGDASWQ